MYRGLPGKILKATLCAALTAGLAIPVYFFLQSEGAKPDPRPDRFSNRRSSGPRHEIRGFRFDSHNDGRMALSIRADRFAIRKKKLGFFKIGLLNEARLENAVIRIYGERALPHTGARAGKPREVPTGRLNFEHAFSKETLPAWKTKRVAGLVVEPVEIVLYDGNQVITRISAARAILRLKQKDVFFTGGVTVVSGDRVLTTDRLSLDPRHSVLTAERPYTLQTPEAVRRGRTLTTDIFLRYHGTRG